MGYRRALLGRWSVRDQLAVLVVAVAVAFLVGSVLLVLAAGGQATAIAAEFESPGSATVYDSPTAARAAAPDDALVLPVASVRVGDGSTTTVVGIPSGADRTVGRHDVALRPPGTAPTWGALDAPRTVQLAGRDATLTVEVHPRDPDASLLSPSWIVADAEPVDRLGPTGAFVLDADNRADGSGLDGSGPDGSGGRVPLLSALGFFLAGTRQALALLGVVVAGGAVLVAVTVFSVTRMGVRDRLTTIRIVRSTGGRPAGVLGLFAGRAFLLTAVGVALGYSLGVILTRGAVNVAVAVGLPTSLAIRVTPTAARVLAPVVVGLLAVGTIAGVVAAWPAARMPPARLTTTAARTTSGGASATGSRLRAAATPALLDWRALVPSVATLAPFVAFVALIATMAGVAAPLAATDGTTVTEPDSTHPVNSQVPTAYADALRARDIDASAEILLFEVVAGQPVPARGADYEAFATVTDARLVRGRSPQAADEAVIGTDLATTLGVDVGDRVPLGGSTRSALVQVTVVGVFTAPGPFDDQVVVPLATAQHLSTVGPGHANVIRAAQLPAQARARTNGGVGVVDVGVPEPVVANRSVPIRVTVRNDAQGPRTAPVTLRFRGQSRTVRLTVPGTSRRTATVRFDAGPPGTAPLRVGAGAGAGAGTEAEADGYRRSIRIVDADTLVLDGLPARAPPESEPRIRVGNATGHPIAGATVRVTPGPRTVDTGTDGTARIPLVEPGTSTVTVTRTNHSAQATVTVSTGVTRQPRTTLRVSPAAPSLLTRPTARLALANPWNRTLVRRVTVAGPGGPYTRAVELAAGEHTTVPVRLPRRPPGTYDLRVRTRGATLATTTYRVTGDERIVSALASSGRSGPTAIGRAIEVAFGNLQLVLGTLVVLAGLMTVGATTATFAQAVHARRTTVGIWRATGAAPLAILRLLLADALRIGVAATALAVVLALGALRTLAAAGFLTLFGVRLAPTPPPTVLAGTAAAALGLTLLGAGLAAASLLARPPAMLLAGARTDRAGRPARTGPGGHAAPARRHEPPETTDHHSNPDGEPNG